MIPRLHHDGPLAEGAQTALLAEQAHYLRNVLRREAGAALKLFNAADGEFAARLADIGKKGAIAAIGARLRSPAVEPDIHLLFALVKRTAIETIIQKATELGVGAFLPVVTDHSNAERVRIDRLQAIALEAAEQSGRLSVPAVRTPLRLADALLHWDAGRTLIYCDEAGDDASKEWGGATGRAAPLYDAVRARGEGRAAILIGPEGGFSPDERRWLRSLPFVLPVTLGPRILRADTAAIAALALWQAAVGDHAGC
jgi:16S rRNA (uracil1498-N3)-methyltransferase